MSAARSHAWICALSAALLTILSCSSPTGPLISDSSPSGAARITSPAASSPATRLIENVWQLRPLRADYAPTPQAREGYRTVVFEFELENATPEVQTLSVPLSIANVDSRGIEREMKWSLLSAASDRRTRIPPGYRVHLSALSEAPASAAGVLVKVRANPNLSLDYPMGFSGGALAPRPAVSLLNFGQPFARRDEFRLVPNGLSVLDATDASYPEPVRATNQVSDKFYGIVVRYSIENLRGTDLDQAELAAELIDSAGNYVEGPPPYKMDGGVSQARGVRIAPGLQKTSYFEFRVEPGSLRDYHLLIELPQKHAHAIYAISADAVRQGKDAVRDAATALARYLRDVPAVLQERRDEDLRRYSTGRDLRGLWNVLPVGTKCGRGDGVAEVSAALVGEFVFQDDTHVQVSAFTFHSHGSTTYTYLMVRQDGQWLMEHGGGRVFVVSDCWPAYDAGSSTPPAAAPPATGVFVERILLNQTNPDPALGAQRSEPGQPHPFLSDLRVRKALAMAVDRSAIAALWSGGDARPTCNALTTPSSMTSTNTKYMDVCRYDIDSANKLLDEIGASRGADGIRTFRGKRMHLIFLTSTNGIRQAEQAVIKKGWSQIGLEVETRDVPSETFFGAAGDASAAKFFVDVEMFTSSPATDGSRPEPESYYSNWACAEIKTRAAGWTGNNYERYCSSEYDSLLADLRRETGAAKRAELATRLNDKLISDVVIIPLVTWSR